MYNLRLSLSPANISASPQRCFRLIWHRDIAQRQINVETTLCTSMLKFTTFSDVETSLYISTLNWTTLGNVETTLSFSKSIFTTLGNVETALWIWPFGKKMKPWFKNKIIFLSFKGYGGLRIFVKYQLVFNFKRQVQAHYDYRSFNFICIF